MKDNRRGKIDMTFEDTMYTLMTTTASSQMECDNKNRSDKTCFVHALDRILDWDNVQHIAVYHE